MSVSVLLNVRHALYDLFADLFLYKFGEDEYKQLLEKIDVVDRELGKQLEEIMGIRVTEIKRVFSETKRSDYLLEYSTLFLSGFGVKPLLPVESKRLFQLMGEKVATFKYTDVIRFYKSKGIVMKFSSQFNPEPDHVSSIFAFMSLLIEEEYEHRSEGRDPFKIVQDEKNFALTHIFSWIPDWINDVINNPRSNIYKIICSELTKFLQFERKYLGVN
ncbi:MAG: molecular chaperone TorD family protein [Saccharolobus sp.]|uniref:TorD/DmsD family molecular chaperone n=1 Tax=Saccharolobus TaxID=2100760 RepID=UPI001F0DDBDC|nr:molecular chaperone TorD family protein [Saccharolobus shibatae]MCH4815728.1 molecular chaperone TorD family protein [Saccharolobus shibatae]